MKKRKSDDDEDGGLDSLLDTMTNVVGILVLVLIVTQLGVSEAITEITASSTVTEEDLEDAKQKLVSLLTKKPNRRSKRFRWRRSTLMPSGNVCVA